MRHAAIIKNGGEDRTEKAAAEREGIFSESGLRTATGEVGGDEEGDGGEI